MPRVVAGVLSALAVLCALAAVSAAFRRGVQPVRETVELLFLPAPANLGYAAFVATLAAALARRKRVAWWMLTVYFGLACLVEALTAVLFWLAPGSVYLDEAGNPMHMPW